MGSTTHCHNYDKALNNKELKEEIIKKEFYKCEVLHISIPKWGAAYVAYKNLNGHADPNKIFCAVVKITCNNSNEIGFKVIDEECGPYYCDCPKKILKILPPTLNEYANNWRKECMEKFKRK